MSVSLISESCCSCRTAFQGYLKDFPIVGVAYSAACPTCGKKNDFSNKAGWIEQQQRSNAVKIFVNTPM